MVGQGMLHREAHPTNVTDIRLFARVGAIVGDQGVTLSKACPADFADIRLFARVGAPVNDQGAAMRKACSTARIIAGVRFLAGVNALVPGQVAWGPERSATPWMVAGALPFANGSLHRVRRRRWGA